MKGLLLYVRQNSIQLVETVVMDDELALAFGAMFKLYARAQFFGQLFLQTADACSARSARAWPISRSRCSSMRSTSSLSSSKRSRFETAARERPTASDTS